jgi:folate-dependent phosphoribosylglycinamide formyltransferase PurN
VNKSDVYVVTDTSTSLKRLFNLIRRGAITPNLLVKMALAEFLRRDYKAPEVQRVHSNSDLLKIIREHKIEKIFLFRVSLIINKRAIGSGAEILNVHCARIPDYGGLGAIMRALRDGAYDQVATLHRVNERIDEGEIIATVPYKLDRNLSYRENEEIAYEAGIQLILTQLCS